jgi:UV DNA damage endonuclease
LFDYCKANNAWGVRLSTHPDQFNVLASENNLSVHKTIAELNHHGWVMDMLGCQRNYYNPINIHVNCTKGDLADIAARFMSNLAKCDESVTSRLVIENEDKGCWTVDNLLKHFRLPITFDNLHDKCNPSETDSAACMYQCAATWNVRPLFHYSESHPDKTNPRSHADMPTDLPASEAYDWDIELKSKDAAIRALAGVALTQQAQELNMGY